MFLFMAELSAFIWSKFLQKFQVVAEFLVPRVFNPDLTKSRLNDALYLCETLTGTFGGTRNRWGLGGFVVLDFV
jgi:hypothetical protein